MPVVLEPDAWPAWVGEGAAGDPVELMRPAGDDVLQLWPVSRAVHSVRNNGDELLLPMVDAWLQTPLEAAEDVDPA